MVNRVVQSLQMLALASVVETTADRVSFLSKACFIHKIQERREADFMLKIEFSDEL